MKKIKNKKEKSVQDWIPIEKIYENGIIKIKNNKFIKILKIIPINFNLKTQLEKKSILNSYKIFLKSCNFNMQILIQSKKENLDQHINNLKNSQNKKSNQKYLNDYINFIEEKNNKNKSVSKNIYLIISNQSKNDSNKFEENIIQELNEKYFKIKENLSRCGNIVLESTKEDTINILHSFFNIKKHFQK